MNDEPKKDKPMNDEPMNNEPINSEPMNNEPMYDAPINDKPMNDDLELDPCVLHSFYMCIQKATPDNIQTIPQFKGMNLLDELEKHKGRSQR